jgi:hypothetical protein
VKRLLLVTAIVFSGFTVSCGGGGSTPPPPPSGGFSNGSLKGQYAFEMTGSDVFGNFLARVGSFTADGNGNITSAIEDVNDAGSNSFIQFTGGTYAIQANGRGTLTLNSAGGGLGLSITLSSTSQGLAAQTDLNATSSGNFILQSAGSFSVPGIANKYVFDTAGIDTRGAPDAIIGQFNADGGGNITGGVLDENDGSSAAPTGALTFGPGGTYGATTANPGTLASAGRGAIDIDGITFVFYIVDGTRIRLLEADGQGDIAGDAVSQSTGIPAQTSTWNPGSFVVIIGGSSVIGTAGPITRATRFTTDGSGNLSAINLDDNNTGSVTSLNSSKFSGATYQIDTSAGVVGSGRGTLTMQASGQKNPFTFVFYLQSPTQAVIYDTSNGVIGDGSLLAQTGGPFAFAGLSANNAFNWSGVNLGSSHNIVFEEDFVGQYALSSSGGISGAMDFTELGSTSNHVAFPNTAITGTLTLNGDGTGRMGSNTYKVTTGTSPTTTFNFTAYIASPNAIFLVGSDTDRVIAGSVVGQQQ